jgi:hypothetical protein
MKTRVFFEGLDCKLLDSSGVSKFTSMIIRETSSMKKYSKVGASTMLRIVAGYQPSADKSP